MLLGWVGSFTGRREVRKEEEEREEERGRDERARDARGEGYEFRKAERLVDGMWARTGLLRPSLTVGRAKSSCGYVIRQAESHPHTHHASHTHCPIRKAVSPPGAAQAVGSGRPVRVAGGRAAATVRLRYLTAPVVLGCSSISSSSSSSSGASLVPPCARCLSLAQSSSAGSSRPAAGGCGSGVFDHS